MRRYIRHPSDIPVEIEPILTPSPRERDRLSNVSLGGIAFNSTNRFDVGNLVRVRIPFVSPEFLATGQVVWCTGNAETGYEVGLELLDQDEAFKARMVEQVCHIEHYKREVVALEGRQLTGEQAAMEWIQKFADKFPHIEQLEAEVEK